MSYHEKSSHVQVLVQLVLSLNHHSLQQTPAPQINSSGTNTKLPHGNSNANTNTNGKGNNPNQNDTKPPDIIREFILSTYKSQLTKEQEQSLAPPYKVTVRSIPSEISGCMPEVHRLYCKYQHAIRGDEDPYIYKDLDTKNVESFGHGRNRQRRMIQTQPWRVKLLLLLLLLVWKEGIRAMMTKKRIRKN